MSKYIYKHLTVSISFKDILKESSVHKDLGCIVREDFQDWFVDFWWNRVRGTSGIDEDGKLIPEKETQEFIMRVFHNFPQKQTSYDNLIRVLKNIS